MRDLFLKVLLFVVCVSSYACGVGNAELNKKNGAIEVFAKASPSMLYFVGEDNYSVFRKEAYKIEVVGLDVGVLPSPYIESGKLMFRIEGEVQSKKTEAVSVDFPSEVLKMWSGGVPDNMFRMLDTLRLDKHPVAVDGALYIPVKDAPVVKVYSSSLFISCITNVAVKDKLLVVVGNFENDKVICVDVKTSKEILEFEIPHLQATQSLFLYDDQFLVATIYARRWCGVQVIDIQERTLGGLYNAGPGSNFFIKEECLFGFDAADKSVKNIFAFKRK